MKRATHTRGLTLLEVIISLSILALIATLIYGAFDGMSASKRGLSRVNDRYHQGRAALTRMSREIQSAFISLHQSTSPTLVVRKTGFFGHDTSPGDRLDFTSFSHRRLRGDTHESDQNELSYFVDYDPNQNSKLDLLRREAKAIDLDPDKGGVVNVIAEDIETFELQYLDPVTGEWVESWDTEQATGQFMRLPLQVKITLVLNGGPGGKPLRFVTRTPVAMQAPLQFANGP
jgi:general secretion pathway protein J